MAPNKPPYPPPSAEPTDSDAVPTYMPGPDETGMLMQLTDAVSGGVLPTPQRSPCVVVLRGPDEGQLIRMRHGEPVVLGRGSDAQLVLLEGGGHMLMLEKAEEVSALIAGFTRQLG